MPLQSRGTDGASAVTASRRSRRLEAAITGPRQPWVILNGRAGQKLGFSTNSSNPGHVRRMIERHLPGARVVPTLRGGHAEELAREAVAAGAGMVVAAGGDGTVREVAEGLIGSDVPLGILPLGSAMNIARALGVPRDVEAAARLLNDGRVVRMEVGEAVTASGRACFLEVAGAGLLAGVFGYANRVDGGDWRAAFELARFVAGFRAGPVRIVVDGHAEVVPRALMVTVAITSHSGAGVMIAPDARVDDRQFVVLVHEARSLLDFTRHLVGVSRGRPIVDIGLRTMTGREVEIVGERTQLVGSADCQMLGKTPMRLTIAPTTLPVVVGPGFRAA